MSEMTSVIRGGTDHPPPVRWNTMLIGSE